MEKINALQRGVTVFLSRLFDYTKIKAQLANGITLMNLSFGIMAIIFIVKGSLHLSLIFILLAALFDRFDGSVARHFNTESEFGKELDSLCDLISFGVAPSLLIYHAVLFEVPVAGLAVTILYILAGAVRLARYNVKEFDGAYCGLPITAAGVAVILSFFLLPYLPVTFFVVFQSLLTILMVAPIKIAKV